jgi:hypothetical protein
MTPDEMEALIGAHLRAEGRTCAPRATVTLMALSPTTPRTLSTTWLASPVRRCAEPRRLWSFTGS